MIVDNEVLLALRVEADGLFENLVLLLEGFVKAFAAVVRIFYEDDECDIIVQGCALRVLCHDFDTRVLGCEFLPEYLEFSRRSNTVESVV